jgi:hypothetical protein
LGSKIYAPEDNMTVVFTNKEGLNRGRQLADVMLYSEASGIVYWLCHLDSETLPEKLSNRTWFDKWSNVKLKKGELIGFVGDFFGHSIHHGLSSDVNIPDDVNAKYGRSYNHVHIETHHCPNIFQLSFQSMNPFNPLLLFRRLY